MIARLGAENGSFDELIKTTRDFYSDMNRFVFDATIKAIWLRGNLKYKDKPCSTLRRNGHKMDGMVGFFMAAIVGHTGKFLMNSGVVLLLQSYFDDFFPEFWQRNPFTDPEYYAFPYKNISFEHLIFVHAYHDRLTLLNYAEERGMNIWDFSNWAADQAYSYNEETGEDRYELLRKDRLRNFPFIRDITKKRKRHGK